MAIDPKRVYHDQPAEDGMAFEVFKIFVKDMVETRDADSPLDSINYQELAVFAYDAVSSFIEVSKEPVTK
jgi:hypothetical protein